MASTGAVDAGLHCLADVPLFHFGVSPNKLFDYLAAGLPVVTNTPGEVAELVKEVGAGIAVAPSDIGAGVRALRRMAADERERLGSAGRAYMAEHRSRTALAAQLQAVLDGLLRDPA